MKGPRKFSCFVIVVFALLFGSPRILRAEYITIADFGSKWGDPTHGTASDIITWSFMDDGTTLYSGHPLIPEVLDGTAGMSDISSLRGSFDAANGAGAFDGAVQNAFDTWAAASPGHITFQQVADNGAVGGDSSNPDSYAVDIRIGAFHSVVGSGFSFSGGVGYGPPGDDLNFPDALAGDILLNLDSAFFVAPGIEDEIFYTGGLYQNDLENLMVHELGHAAIGLGHSTDGPMFSNPGDVMYVDNFPDCCNFVNRELSAQDIAGAISVYGLTGVPEPNTFVLTGLLGVCGLWHVRRRQSH